MVKVKSLEITATSHATEDPDRVVEALKTFLPRSWSGKIETSNLKGYYGNPIIMFKVEISGNDAEEVLENLVSKISKTEFTSIISSFDLRFANSRLYLRFDKQQAYLNRLKLNDGDDVVRLVVRFGGRDSNSKTRVLEYLKSKVSRS